MLEPERYTVGRYDPDFQLCDLYPASINQRGQLSDVPIACGFGGSWEAQNAHEPEVASGGFVSPNWGNVARGARWGQTFPIQPGDMALVVYQGAGASDPIIIGFEFANGNYSIPWLANQLLSTENDYTNQLADDEDLTQGRYDLLLPSGAWLRSAQKSSWTVATAPADRPKAFITLHHDGKIKLKARDGEDYTVHVEFDPAAESGRIVFGSLESGSYLEFKDGNITLKGKHINMLSEQVNADVKPAGSTAMDVLTSTPSAAVTTEQLTGLVTQAAGQMALQSIAGMVPATGVIPVTTQPADQAIATVIDRKPLQSAIMGSLLNNPAIDGALRGRIGDLLTNPQALLDTAIESFQGSGILNDLGIGEKLSGLLGADILSGGLGAIATKLDLTSLPMIQELGVPSWVGEGIQSIIDGGNYQGAVHALLGSMSDSQIMDKLSQFAGDRLMSGASSFDVRSLLDDFLGTVEDGGLADRAQELLKNIDTIPLLTPDTAIATVAQRLGRSTLMGNNNLGGAAELFNNLDDLLPEHPQLDQIKRVAGQIEEFAANPHELVQTRGLEIISNQLNEIPPEIREAIANVPRDLLGRLPQLASGLLGVLPGIAAENPTPEEDIQCSVYEETNQVVSSLPSWEDSERALGALIQSAPAGISQAIASIDPDILSQLQGLPIEEFKGILQNPQAVLDGVDTGMLRCVFGGLTSGATGTFNVETSRRSRFSIMPRSPEPQADLGGREFHPSTVAAPIERVAGEYGRLFIQQDSL